MKKVFIIFLALFVTGCLEYYSEIHSSEVSKEKCDKLKNDIERVGGTDIKEVESKCSHFYDFRFEDGKFFAGCKDAHEKSIVYVGGLSFLGGKSIKLQEVVISETEHSIQTFLNQYRGEESIQFKKIFRSERNGRKENFMEICE